MQSGIVNWWQIFFKQTIRLQTERNVGTKIATEFTNDTMIKPDHSRGKAGVYILCLIPAIGLLVSLAVFVCYDCQALKTTAMCIKTIAIAPKNNLQRELRKDELQTKRIAIHTVNSNSGINRDFFCIFCSNFSAQNMVELELHLLEVHDSLLIERLRSHLGTDNERVN